MDRPPAGQNPAMTVEGYYLLINTMRHAQAWDGVDRAFRDQVFALALCRPTGGTS